MWEIGETLPHCIQNLKTKGTPIYSRRELSCQVGFVKFRVGHQSNDESSSQSSTNKPTRLSIQARVMSRFASRLQIGAAKLCFLFRPVFGVSSRLRMAPRDRVLCTCRWKCARLTYEDRDGVTCKGNWIPPTTQTNHRQKDAANAIPNLGPPSSWHNATTTPSTEDIAVVDAAHSVTSEDLAGHHEGRESMTRNNGGGEAPTPAQLCQSLYTAASALGAWLHLVCGLGRAVVASTMTAIQVFDPSLTLPILQARPAVGYS
ncbi:hypothetical protein BKA70DRAFT_1232167 [Coprinopsis sp. MPI-PUGE-AT-0042]|nr:hypothetical protein BKA70DRAFT_1232167 [Coprinopsis sp. MPI-PUGE-AT-0042]